MLQLLSKTDLQREEIYPIIQDAAFKSKEEGREFNLVLNDILKTKNLDSKIEWKDINDMKEKYRKIAITKFKKVLSIYPL